MAEQNAVQNELAPSSREASDRERERLERADRGMRRATCVDLPLILLAGLMLAVGRSV